MSAEALLDAARQQDAHPAAPRTAPGEAPGEGRAGQEADNEPDVPKGLKEEVGAILHASWPQIAVIACRIATSFTDTAVVGKLGTDELAGTAFASIIIQVSGIFIWSGVGDTMITLTSQAHGAKNYELASAWLQIGCLMAMVLSLPVGLVWWYCGEILRSTGQAQASDPGVIHWATVFGRMSTLWLIPDSLACAYGQWVTGLEKVRATVPIYAIFMLLNLVFNIVLVHGVRVGEHQLYAGMGFYGSPIATTVTTLGRLVALVWFMRPQLPPVRWSLANVTREVSDGDCYASFWGARSLTPDPARHVRNSA
jgi:Na+-driven multidrug efflux pump